MLNLTQIAWLFALAVLLLAAVYSRGFRMLLAGTLAIGVVVAWLSLAVDAQHDKVVRSRIAVREVAIEDARLGGRGRSYTLTGRIRNGNSAHSVSSVDVSITLRDCDSSGRCDVVGQDSASEYISIPPNQARDMDAGVYFNPTPAIKGRMEWSYEVTGISADN